MCLFWEDNCKQKGKIQDATNKAFLYIILDIRRYSFDKDCLIVKDYFIVKDSWLCIQIVINMFYLNFRCNCSCVIYIHGILLKY